MFSSFNVFHPEVCRHFSSPSIRSTCTANTIIYLITNYKIVVHTLLQDNATNSTYYVIAVLIFSSVSDFLLLQNKYTCRTHV